MNDASKVCVPEGSTVYSICPELVKVFSLPAGDPWEVRVPDQCVLGWISQMKSCALFSGPALKLAPQMIDSKMSVGCADAGGLVVNAVKRASAMYVFFIHLLSYGGAC